MAYEKHDWQTGEIITEALLDSMENGIANAYITTVTVTADNNTGTPSATGSVNGNTLTLDFKNLKGDKGEQGPKGDTGATGAQGEQGPQGPAGVGLTGTASSITALAGTEDAAAICTKVNEIITQLEARGVLAGAEAASLQTKSAKASTNK